MKRWLILIGVVILAVRWQAAAQEDAAEWRLRVPSVEEYLMAVPTLLQSGKEAAQAEEYLSSSSPIFNVITTEIETRYQPLQQHDPALLNPVYRSLVLDNEYWDDRDIWVQAIILAWINTNTVDLETFKQFQILDYSVRVNPRDFDADEKPEWWLHVEGNITKDIVVAGDKGSYQLVESPLPWFGCCFMYSSTRSGFMKEQLFEDLNHDGLPEWIWAVGGFGANQTSGGYLYFLQWQDGKLVDLAPPDSDPDRIFYTAPAGGGSPVFPNGVLVEYADKNGDGKKEIVIVQEQSDNWGCTWTKQLIYAWEGEGYGFEKEEKTFDKVQGCAIRQAEETMWAGDYQTAITYYEHGVDLEPTEAYFSGDAEEISRYATARLALAYTLAGRYDEADSVINALPLRSDDSNVLVELIDSIKANSGNSSAMCQAAYEVFTFECPSGTDSCLGSPLNAVVGRTDENSGYGVDHPAQSFPAPSLAGCDPAIPLADALEKSPLSTGEPIIKQLEERGSPVLESLHFDLNQDGVDEWLVWLTAPVPALFFYAEAGDAYYQKSYAPLAYDIGHPNGYTLSVSGLNPFSDSKVIFTTRPAPDLKSRLLIGALDSEYRADYYYWCPVENGFGSILKSFAVWKLKDAKLEYTSEIPFCEPVELESLFGDENEPIPLTVSAWAPILQNFNPIGTTATYKWNTDVASYILDSTTIVPIPDLPTDYTHSYFAALWDIKKKIVTEQDYETALEIIERGLTNPDLFDVERKNLIYLHALTLELSGKIEEALAAYVTIYEAAPESAWGMLARLHIEPVM